MTDFSHTASLARPRWVSNATAPHRHDRSRRSSDRVPLVALCRRVCEHAHTRRTNVTLRPLTKRIGLIYRGIAG